MIAFAHRHVAFLVVVATLVASLTISLWPTAVTRVDALEVNTTATITGDTIALTGVRLGSAGGPTIRKGTGDPNGVVTAPQGSLFVRTDTAGLYLDTNGGTAWTLFDTLSNFSGDSLLFGTGDDGPLTFDGSATVTLANGTTIVPSSGVYTLPQSIYASNMSVTGGCRIKVNGYPIYVSGTLSGACLTCSIDANGADAVANVQGAAAAGANLPAGSSGGSGAINNSSTATSGGALSNVPGWISTTAANGGACSALGSNSTGASGGSGHGAAGGCGDVATGGTGAGGVPTYYATVSGKTDYASEFAFYTGRPTTNPSTGYSLCTGGGGGAASNANAAGGGGGGGGAMVYVGARFITYTGHIDAKGGSGSANGNGTGGGGGGGGCQVHIATASITQTWASSAAGGAGGFSNSGHGGSGGSGAVRIKVIK